MSLMDGIAIAPASVKTEIMILAMEGIWGTIASVIVVVIVLGGIIFINYAGGKKDIIKNTMTRHNYKQ